MKTLQITLQIAVLCVMALTVIMIGCSKQTTEPSETAPSAPSAETSQPAPSGTQTAGWSCPMHPEVKENQAGKCPTCGMDLVQKP